MQLKWRDTLEQVHRFEAGNCARVGAAVSLLRSQQQIERACHKRDGPRS